ncbi:hypothetical protein BC835DRAFT_816493 [Cytidiella melzeri]|nr:hypothetical protein BC835DRAFT_816493 [Cytidiella melzeri]
MMHPWHWHRPSRLFWFVFGAISSAWVMKHKESVDNFKVKHCSRHQIPQEAYHPPQGSGQEWQNRWRDRHYSWGWGPQTQNETAAAMEAPAAANATSRPKPPQAVATAVDEPSLTVDGWDEERQRLLNIKQQAANSLLDFSEEGLDSLLTSMESLKARLAERRAEREREARERAEREADFKQFEEWKRERALRETQPQTKESPKRLV